MVISLDKIIDTYHLNIRGVIHIGAHWGQEYTDYKRRGIKKVIFFEPVRNTFNMLKSKIPKDDNIMLFNIALGNETGKKKMFIEHANNGQSSSLLKPKGHLYQYPYIVFDGEEIVTIDKLDNIVFERIDYNMINIDVQGYELEVFRGAIETIKHINIIYTEVNCDEVYEGCARVEQLDLFLKDFGFERIETYWAGVTWGDALYLKHDINSNN